MEETFTMSEDGKTAQNDGKNRDRLSNLPLNVLDKILVKLPLKAAARTSILSKQWRFKWGHLSRFAIEFNRKYSVDDERAKSFVYRYLLYHNNEIDMFKLSATYQLSSNLCAWIHILSLKVVKKFVIVNCHLRAPYDELPPSLFSFQHLECLEVIGYKIKVPHTFGGFSSLTILHLSEVFIDGKELQILINRCHALQRLKLSSTIAVKKFVVENCHSRIPCFELPPSLSSFKQLFLEVNGYEIKVPRTFVGFSSLTTLHLTDVLIDSKELQILTIKCHALQSLKLSSTIDVENFVDNNCHSRIPCFELPTSQFCFQQLKFLEVNGYKIKVPFLFRGLRSLRSLHLADVLIDEEELEILINVCPSLESLKLSSIQRLKDCIIHVPTLIDLEIVSTTENLRFSATGKLLSANLTLDDPSVINRKMMFAALSDPTDCVCPMPIEIFKAFDLEHKKAIFSLKHAHLSRVRVDGPLNLNDIKEVRVFLSILGGFPNLKELHFSVSCCFESSDHFEFPEDLQWFNLKKLQVVSVEYNSHLSILAEFLRLIIGRSPRIGTLEITKCFQPLEEIQEHGKRKCFQKRFRKKVRRLREVSPLVKIIYREKKICPSS